MIGARSYLPSLVTFPGAVLRQVIHQVTCRMMGVPVLDVRYFRFDTPAAYVLHEMPKSLGASIVLSTVPFLFHSFLCLALCLPAMAPLGFEESLVGPGSLFQVWLGLSLGVHAFPPNREALHQWELARGEVRAHGALVRISIPLLAFFRLAQRGSRWGVEWGYALFLGILVPWVILARWIPSQP